jgi:putative endonuclease
LAAIDFMGSQGKCWVYVLRGSAGRHYVGQTNDLEARLRQHRSGQTYTTARLGETIELVAAREYPDRLAALKEEKRLKAWKNPAKVIAWLTGSGA